MNNKLEEPQCHVENNVEFGHNFNEPIEIEPLPQCLTFEFGTQPLPTLPESLQKLVFGDNFNQPIGVLPKGVQTLEFFEDDTFTK